MGRLVQDKGVHLYVEAVSKIAKKYPDWSFYITGADYPGSDKKRQLFIKKEYDKFIKIGNQANFTGFLSYEDVQVRMQKASIVVVPSIWDEPFGLVVAEAMSNGAAIITSKVGGIPEIIQGNGCVLEDIDEVKVQQALENLMKDPKKLSIYQKKSWENFILSSQASTKQLDKHRSKTILKIKN